MTDEAVQTDSSMPTFEGQSVAGTRVKIGTATLEIDDAHYSLDEVARFIIEARVTNVTHVVNDTTGLLHRVHTFKITEVQPVTWEVDLTGAQE